MKQMDHGLKMYAENGLRTMEDWATLGREITGGEKPRLDADHRGVRVFLFSRDQTHHRPTARAGRV